MARQIKTNSLGERLRLQPSITSDQAKSILNALPDQTIDTRIKILPEVLQRWYQTELIEHLGFEPSSEDVKLLDNAKRFITSAEDIISLITNPDGEKLRDIINSKGWEAAGIIAPTRKDLAASEARLDDLIKALADIKTALYEYASKHKRIRGRPRNCVNLLILLDIAELYGWVTNFEPTRQYDSTRSTETGHFYKFASAIWQIIFGNKNGLQSTIKLWAEKKKVDKDFRSALIYNMGLDIADYGE